MKIQKQISQHDLSFEIVFPILCVIANLKSGFANLNPDFLIEHTLIFQFLIKM